MAYTKNNEYQETNRAFYVLEENVTKLKLITKETNRRSLIHKHSVSEMFL